MRGCCLARREEEEEEEERLSDSRTFPAALTNDLTYYWAPATDPPPRPRESVSPPPTHTSALPPRMNADGRWHWQDDGAERRGHRGTGPRHPFFTDVLQLVWIETQEGQIACHFNISFLVVVLP